jgi:hypothetical protein
LEMDNHFSQQHLLKKLSFLHSDASWTDFCTYHEGEFLPSFLLSFFHSFLSFFSSILLSFLPSFLPSLSFLLSFYLHIGIQLVQFNYVEKNFLLLLMVIFVLLKYLGGYNKVT